MVKYQDSDPEKWILKEHTKIKHEILARYLVPWAKILASFNKRLCIVDGFAGRGEYYENNISQLRGSPLILMDLSRDPIVEELTCICIEKNQDNCNNLCKVLDEKKRDGLGANRTHVDFSNVEIVKITDVKDSLDLLTDKMLGRFVTRSKIGRPSEQKTTIFVINGKFENTSSLLIQSMKERKQTTAATPAPSFYFLDPYGFNGIPFDLIKNILYLPRSEILLTFMTRDLNRFNPLPQEEKALIKLFGSSNWKKELANEGQEGQEKFAGFYKKILKENGIEYVLPFTMSESDRKLTLYYLIHACNNLKAIRLMKDEMSKISPHLKYYGPDENRIGKNQVRLTEFAEHPLKGSLLNIYKKKSVTFEKILDDTIDSNVYREKIYRDTIKSMEKEGLVTINRIQSVTRGLSDNDVVIFR
jgi:three-Cys-motif partner protein